MNVVVPLRSGTLTLEVEESDLPLSALCDFGSRRNRKRGFLFISKVLGKHIPVRPSRMREVHERLARKLPTFDGPVVLIAMAETATALGQGVFESLLEQTGRDDVLFQHSTRYRLSRPLALTFDESHSHVPEHLLYEPASSEDLRLFHAARTLILVDDEISTGRTLANLIRAYRQVNSSLQNVVLVSITDWMGEERRSPFRTDCGLETTFVSLLRGRYHFVDAPTFDPGEPPRVVGRGDLKDAILPSRGGRTGIRECLSLDAESLLSDVPLKRGERLLVLGTGEFAYPPYLLARLLEDRGQDVLYQSTTRSPILQGEAIRSVLEFVDNYHDEMPNYVYNVADRTYDRVLIGYETCPLPQLHKLPDLLKAHILMMR